MNARLSGLLDWLREGYPTGIPPTDYVPLLALLRRRLTEDEVREVAAEIVRLTPPGNATDVGVSITRITDALPSEAELARVERHLTVHHGWPTG